MKSLKELYRIGKGPSSSHTMGPQKAAQTFAAHNKDAKSFEVTLYGSLAATGRGHMTDVAIDEVLRPIAPLSIVWQPKRVPTLPPERHEVRSVRRRRQPHERVDMLQRRRRRTVGSARRAAGSTTSARFIRRTRCTRYSSGARITDAATGSTLTSARTRTSGSI